MDEVMSTGVAEERRGKAWALGKWIETIQEPLF
jgi:hypothetical protein